MKDLPRSIEWHALITTQGVPVIRILPDDQFEAHLDKRSSAYKQYGYREDGSSDYSKALACILRFRTAPDELLIRESAFPEIQKLREEIEVLRAFGNKDCTAMADAELARRRSSTNHPGPVQG